MSHTIRGFQEDQAVLLADKIEKKTGEKVAPSYIQSIIQRVGIVSDHTYWLKLPHLLSELGFDYDEIEEVAP